MLQIYTVLILVIANWLLYSMHIPVSLNLIGFTISGYALIDFNHVYVVLEKDNFPQKYSAD